MWTRCCGYRPYLQQMTICRSFQAMCGLCLKIVLVHTWHTYDVIFNAVKKIPTVLIICSVLNCTPVSSRLVFVCFFCVFRSKERGQHLPHVEAPPHCGAAGDVQLRWDALHGFWIVRIPFNMTKPTHHTSPHQKAHTTNIRVKENDDTWRRCGAGEICGIYRRVRMRWYQERGHTARREGNRREERQHLEDGCSNSRMERKCTLRW